MPKPNIKKLYKATDEHKAQELDKKFKESPFAKKYKKQFPITQEQVDTINEHVAEIKSWKRSPISETVNLTYLFLAFIIGFSVCAIVLTPLVINSI